jgi:hypothetical protein
VLTLNGCAPICATENTTWGGVKDLFR